MAVFRFQGRLNTRNSLSREEGMPSTTPTRWQTSYELEGDQGFFTSTTNGINKCMCWISRRDERIHSMRNVWTLLLQICAAPSIHLLLKWVCQDKQASLSWKRHQPPELPKCTVVQVVRLDHEAPDLCQSLFHEWPHFLHLVNQKTLLYKDGMMDS